MCGLGIPSQESLPWFLKESNLIGGLEWNIKWLWVADFHSLAVFIQCCIITFHIFLRGPTELKNIPRYPILSPLCKIKYSDSMTTDHDRHQYQKHAICSYCPWQYVYPDYTQHSTCSSWIACKLIVHPRILYDNASLLWCYFVYV